MPNVRVYSVIRVRRLDPTDVVVVRIFKVRPLAMRWARGRGDRSQIFDYRVQPSIMTTEMNQRAINEKLKVIAGEGLD